MPIQNIIKVILSLATLTGSTAGILRFSNFSNFSNSLEEKTTESIFNHEVFSESFDSTSKDSQLDTLSDKTSLPEQKFEEENFQERELKKEERITKAIKAHKLLNDYTFKLFFPCNSATGWILDYELPSKKGRYPTTWYFATAAHVIEDRRFSKNPYEQILPFSLEITKAIRKETNYYRLDWSEINLLTRTCYNQENYGYFDLAIVRQDSDYGLRSGLGLVANKKIKEPKLFYLPMNFFSENPELGIKDQNYKDFAVIEVEFASEKVAQEITNNFANKYPVNSKNALNIFAPSLRERYTKEELDSLDQDFYQLGYPEKAGDWEYLSSYDWDKGEGLRLSEDPRNRYNTPGQTKINGHMNADRLWEINWDNKKRAALGSYYLMQSDPSKTPTGGASGSMMIDQDGNILGVLVGVEKNGRHSFFTPLRQNEMNYGIGGLKSPKYDFILGAKGQKGSYKEQIERYKKRTWLQARGWKHIT